MSTHPGLQILERFRNISARVDAEQAARVATEQAARVDAEQAARVPPQDLQAPIVPPSLDIVVSRPPRAPRKCSGCRQTGHTIQNCPGNNVAREALFDNIIDRIARRVPELLSYPEIFSTAMDDIHRYIRALSIKDVREGSRPGSLVIRNCYALITDILNVIEERTAATSGPLLGKDHAKKIDIEFDVSGEDEINEAPECFICCNQVCSVKSGCGHEFCGECVMTILETEKNKTTSACCSFCRVPFVSFATSDYSTYDALCDFIEKL